MTRKLHRRSAERFFFPTKGNGGEYVEPRKTDMGISRELEESRRECYDGFNYQNVERVLRLVESGFSDEDIAELLMIPVEEIEEIIEQDKKREENTLEKLRTLVKKYC